MGNSRGVVRAFPKWGLVAIALVAIAAVVLVLTWGRGGAQQVAAHEPHPGLDFSMEVVGVDGCTTKGGDTKCDLFVGKTYTVAVSLNTLPGDIASYDTFDVSLTYSGVTSKDNADTSAWPDCVFDAYSYGDGTVLFGCVIGIRAPSSTYTGVIGTNDFNCTASESSGNTITLVHGYVSGDTALLDSEGAGHAESGTETLTINCAPINVNGDWGVTYVSSKADYASICSLSLSQTKTEAKEETLTATGTCVFSDGSTGALNMPTGTINDTTGAFTLSGTVGDSTVNSSGIAAKDGNTSKGSWNSKTTGDWGTFTAARVLESVSEPITAATGGTVATINPDNPVQASLFIDEGALEGDTTITVDVLLPGAEPPPEEFLPNVPDPENAPDFVLIFDFGPPGTILDPPALLTLTYDPDVISGDENALGILHFNQTINEWEYLPVKNRDTEAHTITVNVSSFSPYGIYEPSVADTDSDGCLDTQEDGDDPDQGGLRNPVYHWDVFDTPTDTNARDKMIRVADILRVVGRYGQDGDAGIDPLSPPPETGYHTAFDRGGPAGPNAWDQAPPNGMIRVLDINAVVSQYGLTC